MSAVRVRFAPSPTGHLHVGNARTALFNWLLARRHGGTFILRIEDTDVERSTRESEQTILDDLRWLGLDWDEGPDVTGAAGPYRQSERTEGYAAAARDLLDRGAAYYCFCSPELLEQERSDAVAAGHPPKYSGRCRTLDRSASADRVARGEAAAIRLAVPAGRDVRFTDLVRGDVAFHTDVIGDPVLVRSGGVPAYNFAVVVDDDAMQITHVIRGEDHISNTPRQILIYEALGMSPPQFAHVALVLGPDHARLSKRHGATSVAEFRERGYLAEALVNYLALLGWSPGDDEEILGLDEMARRFDLARVGHSAAVFDVGKLSWINRHYMKVAEPAWLARQCWRHFSSAGFADGPDCTPDALHFLEHSVLPMTIGSVDRLEEIPERASFLFDWDVGDAALLVRAEETGKEAVTVFATLVGDRVMADRETFRAIAAEVRARTGLKGKALFHPLRVALTGRESGPELDLAIPAIDRGAQARPTGLRPIRFCAERARLVVTALSR